MAENQMTRRQFAITSAAVLTATAVGGAGSAEAVPPLFVGAVAVLVSVVVKRAVQKVSMEIVSSGASKAAAKEVAKRFIAGLPRYSPDTIRTADHLLLRAVADKTIAGDGIVRHWYIKGNADDVFRQITKGAVKISDTHYRDGVKDIVLYNASSNGVPTIAINTAALRNKVRIIHELAE